MEFFIDTASLDEIREANALGLIDGVTTNPTLMAREGRDWRAIARAICDEVEGPVSLEVVGTTADAMVEEARELMKFGPNVVVKIPMLPEGMKAVRTLSAMGIQTNVTLVFSPNQALLAAKAGATYVSPFVGRIDAIGGNGMDVVSQILTIYGQYGFGTKVLVASVRHSGHVLESALMGADVITIPFGVIKQLAHHPLTDSGLEAFLKDAEKLQ
ncbi:fructose-6-phosphate aldolase [Salidesulfovibrio onnuriiensis]|uniref:fructose-6-phosphate aldolase n=1 Tax=Salidesulfovibrio onnuriiensis TaxID=2583823 RepID=UPI0011CB4C14|nr:fructose-6-phosphate aldolase [Salidesulfovibrio onnuriiensis]